MLLPLLLLLEGLLGLHRHATLYELLYRDTQDSPGILKTVRV